MSMYLTKDDMIDGMRAKIERLRAALTEIAAIENEEYGGDWDEIERAREIAAKALAQH